MQQEEDKGLQPRKAEDDVKTEETASIGDAGHDATVPEVKEGETKPRIFEALRRACQMISL